MMDRLQIASAVNAESARFTIGQAYEVVARRLGIDRSAVVDAYLEWDLVSSRQRWPHPVEARRVA